MFHIILICSINRIVLFSNPDVSLTIPAAFPIIIVVFLLLLLSCSSYYSCFPFPAFSLSFLLLFLIIPAGFLLFLLFPLLFLMVFYYCYVYYVIPVFSIILFVILLCIHANRMICLQGSDHTSKCSSKYLYSDVSATVDGWQDVATSHIMPTRSSSPYVQKNRGLNIAACISHKCTHKWNFAENFQIFECAWTASADKALYHIVRFFSIGLISSTASCDKNMSLSARNT